MTPDELKSIPKGQFVVMKSGFHPMRTRLRLLCLLKKDRPLHQGKGLSFFRARGRHGEAPRSHHRKVTGLVQR